MSPIDFGAIPDSKEFEPIPEDRYTLECVKAEVGLSNAGNSKIDAQFKILDEGGFKNRFVFGNFSLLPNALFNLKNYFDAAGIAVDGPLEEEEIPDLMLNTTATAFIKSEKYTNKNNEEKISNKPENWAAVVQDGKNLFS